MNKENVYVFDKCLAQSKRDSQLDFIQPMIDCFFGKNTQIVWLHHKGEHQNAGLDARVTLSNGESFTFEFKTEWKTTGNMFLEYWSDFDESRPAEQNKLGWIEKSLRCDFLIAAYPLEGWAFKFDWIALQKAWFYNKHQWIDRYGEKRIKNENGNKSWVTIGVPVPFKEVRKRYYQQQSFSFEPCKKQ